MIEHNLPSIYTSNTELEGNLIGPNSILILDPKRRRVDMDSDYNKNIVSTQDQTMVMETLAGDTSEPKNDLVVGAAVQARHSS